MERQIDSLTAEDFNRLNRQISDRIKSLIQAKTKVPLQVNT